MYGVDIPLPIRWPTKQPDEVLDYFLDASAMMSEVSDTISAASISISPPAELAVQAFTANRATNMLTVWLSGGVPGRAYKVRIELNTAGSRTFEWIISLLVSSALATYPLPTPAPGFSAVTAATLLNAPSPAAPGALTIKQGATLQLLLAVTNDDGSVFDLSVVTVTAQLRVPVTLSLVATLPIVVTGIPGQLSITEATATWSPGNYICDIAFTDPATSVVVKSNTFSINVVAAVTSP